MVARPLINLYYPGFVEPLSSASAARRALLASLPFPVGYGAALSLLLDAATAVGAQALAQTRLGPRPETDVSLPDLGEAAYATHVSATARIHGREDLDERAPGPLFLPLPGRFELRRVAVEERPPLDKPSAISRQRPAPPPGRVLASRWRSAGQLSRFGGRPTLGFKQDPRLN